MNTTSGVLQLLKRTVWRVFSSPALTLVLSALLLPMLGDRCNSIVVSANGGQMPVWIVSSETALTVGLSNQHRRLTEDTKYKALADIIPVYAWFDGELQPISVMSIGDVCIETGDLLVFASELLLPLLFLRWAVKKDV